MVTIMATDPDLRTKMRGRIEPLVGDDTRVVVAHSLGTVLSYMALANHPQWNVHTFVTLGSPLGVADGHRRCSTRPSSTARASGPARSSAGSTCGRSATRPAANPVAERFGDRVEEVLVDNGHRAHAPEPYLNSAPTGAAIAEALTS